MVLVIVAVLVGWVVLSVPVALVVGCAIRRGSDVLRAVEAEHAEGAAASAVPPRAAATADDLLVARVGDGLHVLLDLDEVVVPTEQLSGN